MSMAYYRFFPGDYARDTRHLSMLQHGAYRQLIDEYMVHGRLPNDLQRLYRICGAFNAEERSAVEYVLGEFFLLDGPVWKQSKCDGELAWQASKSEAARGSAVTGWEKRRNGEGMRTHSERNTNAMLTRTRIKHPENPSPNGEPESYVDLWISLLTSKGVKKEQARSFVGMLRKDWADPVIADAFRAAHDAAEPKAYILRILDGKPKKAQAALIAKRNNDRAAI